MAATGSQKKWAEPKDWEDAKPVIVRLYMDEKKKLKEVMAEMEARHSFKAT